MSCIIYSKLKNIQPSVSEQGIWTRLKYKALENNNEYLNCNIYELIKPTDTIIKQGFGLLVEINNSKYIITCYHIIGLINIEITAIILNLNNDYVKTNLEHVKSIPEFDISILKFKNTSEENNFYFYSENELNIKICNIFENIQSNNTLNNNSNDDSTFVQNEIFLKLLTIKSLKENIIINSNIGINNIELTHEDFIGHIVPKLPLITFNCNDEFENDSLEGHTIEGLSGSQIVKNEIPIGMVMSYSQYYNKFQTIPIIFIIYVTKCVLNNFQNNDTDIATITSYNIPTITKCGVMKNGTRLYLKYVSSDSIVSYFTEKKKSFIFKQGYCIIKVNNCEIKQYGKIYCDDIGCDVNTDTFLMIKSLKNRYCNFNICIDLNTEKNINITLQAKNLNTLYNINIFNNHQYIYWKGLTFVELSEELLIDLSYIFDDNFKGNIVTQLKQNTENKKYVIIIDVNKQIIDINTQITNIDDHEIIDKFPIIEKEINDNKYLSIVFLQKIGTKHINNINDLKNAIKSKPSKRLHIYYQLIDEITEFNIIL